ncbi:MAG: tRNA (5-methylaminomethyl-2-thiouridine)(34)-methyltransferase MnmD [Rhodobacteraceae bacterium]|nr:tRNA (5-methylaminomethyl-2-thiouridine)(34)-methyltransferase MnmD [Paracoccaceae bacterium]
MQKKDQSERVEWRDGVTPVSSRFDDPYFSLEGGLSETRHVFLAGNHLPDRFRDGFHVAELGFGTGLNLLATVIAWRASGAAGRLRYTSFEAYPMPAGDIARALAAFSELEPFAAALIAEWQSGQRRFALGTVDITVIEGDARQTLPAWNGRADAWYLDGFSPAKNPELWSEEMMAGVAGHTAPRGTFATYTAAGFVRRGLQAAGFQVERCKGYGHKRHMSRGQLGEAA